MIKLENVSTEEYLDYLLRTKFSYIEISEIYYMLKKYRIENFQVLKEFLAKYEKRDLFYVEMMEHLTLIERKIQKANEEGKTPQLFTFDAYANSYIDKDTLEFTDKQNSGNVLLYGYPYITRGTRFNIIKSMSIHKIKHLCSHLDCYKLQNALCTKRDIGLANLSIIVEKIKFYDEQVLRQAKETKATDVNLFMLNKKEKDLIVESGYKEIIEYIVDSANVCVWGNLTDAQKKRLMNSVLAARSNQAKQDRECMINAISNYTTLSELRKGIVKRKILDRFIIK